MANLLAVMPTPTRARSTMAHYLSDSILSLLTNQTELLNLVLQLHFIDIVESLILGDSPVYKVVGFTLENFNISNMVQPTLIMNKANETSRDSRSSLRMSLSDVEEQTRLLPRLLQEVARVCAPAKHGDSVGSQEVLGLRQRWINSLALS